MGFVDIVSKVSTVVKAPINLVCDWGREPLRHFEHKRELDKIAAEKQWRLEEATHKQDLVIRAEAEKATLERAMEQFHFDLLENEKDNQLKRKIADDQNAANMVIKKETEIIKVIEEIEQWKKDQEFNRMIAVSEAIIKFQERLSKINVDAINAIGYMQLDLRDKAYDLIAQKTYKYKELQDLAMNDAFKDLKRIEDEFSNNEAAKKILTNAVDKRLANIITTADNFLIELNKDILSISQNINLLADSGQRFIERHLEQFKHLNYSNGQFITEQSTEYIETKSLS